MYERIAQQFNAGGAFMWVILGVFAIAVAVMLERTIYYYIICGRNAGTLTDDIISAIRRNALTDARSLIGTGRTPLLVLLRTALDSFTGTRDDTAVRTEVEQQAIEEIPRMSRRLNYLSLFANIATLLGLLGTISGLQVSFSSLASVDAAEKATMLARGISQAMNTTAFGLIVAVPCMVMFTFLHNKQQQLVQDMDRSVARVLHSITESAA